MSKGRRESERERDAHRFFFRDVEECARGLVRAYIFFPGFIIRASFYGRIRVDDGASWNEKDSRKNRIGSASFLMPILILPKYG